MPFTVPRAPSTYIPQESFTTKTALKTRCQSILRAGNPIPLADQRFLLALVHGYHPEAREKVGPGNRIYGGTTRVVRVSIRPNGGSNGFWIERSDGEST